MHNMTLKTIPVFILTDCETCKKSETRNHLFTYSLGAEKDKKKDKEKDKNCPVDIYLLKVNNRKPRTRC